MHNFRAFFSVLFFTLWGPGDVFSVACSRHLESRKSLKVVFCRFFFLFSVFLIVCLFFLFNSPFYEFPTNWTPRVEHPQGAVIVFPFTVALALSKANFVGLKYISPLPSCQPCIQFCFNSQGTWRRWLSILLKWRSPGPYSTILSTTVHKVSIEITPHYTHHTAAVPAEIVQWFSFPYIPNLETETKTVLGLPTMVKWR